jgi:hypothetical protein
MTTTVVFRDPTRRTAMNDERMNDLQLSCNVEIRCVVIDATKEGNTGTNSSTKFVKLTM